MFHIGIAGYKRSGKDTVAQMLIEELNSLNIIAQRRAFADSLKEEVADFLSKYFNPKYPPHYYLNIMHSDGPEKERFRLLMQWWGTEGRRHDDPNYWMDRVGEYAKSANCAALITPDVRFKNEINWIENHKGVVICVKRPGADSSEHASENDINGFDNWYYVINNTSDIRSLRIQVNQLANLLHSYFTTGS